MRSVRHVLLLPVWILLGCAGEEASPPSGAASTPDAPAEAGVSTRDDEPRRGAPGSEATPGGVRVVTLGTSLTAGMGLDDPESTAWPALLEARAEEAGVDVEVVNAGVSGDTSAGGLRRLDWVLRDRVDLLVVELGANDGLRGLPLDQLEANLDSVLARTRARRPEARIALIPMEAPPNLGTEYTEAFRAIFTEVAGRHDAILLPFILDGVAGVPELNQADGIHPTPEGHRRMLDNVWPTLAPVLREIGR